MSEREREYVEDKPEMRSVAMAPRQMAVPMPRGFGLATKSPGATAEYSTRSEIKTATASTAWNVGPLLPLPDFYLLERTNVYVNNASASEVASRIASCLREESIHAEFSSDEAMVDAVTRDHVEFSVRLWSDQGSVVVEVQRLTGCGYLFHRSCTAVLKAARGRGGGGKQRPRSPSPPPLPSSFPIPDCVPHDDTVKERTEEVQEGLDIACDLLKKDRLDGHRLAIESLVQMTASERCRSYAARALLSGTTLETLIGLVEAGRMDRLERSSSDNVSVSELEGDHFAVMHHQALQVLANCMVALDDSGSLHGLLAEKDELRSDSFVSALVDDVARAQHRPHDAYQAVRCLKCLAQASNESKIQVQRAGASSAVAGAGLCRHAHLEEASHNLSLFLRDM